LKPRRPSKLGPIPLDILNRIRGRRGPGRAAVAVGHSILVIVWNLLSTAEVFSDYFEQRRNSDARQRRLVAQLEAMRHTVTLTPAA
jgi:hypothetical protein